MSEQCFHCGLEVPHDVHLSVHYHEKDEAVCCVGCQAVAQGIIDAGLGRYYDERTADAPRSELPPQEILDQLKLYDLPEVQGDFVETTAENEREALLMLSGMTCSACVWLIEQRLMRTDGVCRVDLNYSTHRARVAWNTQKLKLSDILLLIRKTGYEAHPYDALRAEENAQKERKQSILRLWVAALSMMQVMMYAVPTYLFGDIEPQFLWLLHWANMVLTLPVVLYAAVPFYRGAWRDFKNRRVGMDTPVSIAIVLAFVASTIALVRREEGGVFFDSLSMFVFLLLGGRFLEQIARSKAADAADRLVKLIPAFCHRLKDYPHSQESEEFVVAQLHSDDVLLIKPGEVIVADGEVVFGEGEVNEAMLTGESLPVPKQVGDRVTAGCHNGANPLGVRVVGVGNQTRLGAIVRLLDGALSQKPRIAKMADRYASWFIAALLITAVVVFSWWAFKTDTNRALWVTVSLLVITCPCALSLATPAALTAATGHLTSLGVLVSNGSALETLPQIDDVIFDKTGTLTEGILSVQNVHGLDDRDKPLVQSIVRSLESQSEHPIARALVKWADGAQLQKLEMMRNVLGQGLEAQIDGTIYRLGRFSFVAQLSGYQSQPIENATVYLGDAHNLLAAFVLSDTIRDCAQSTLQSLRQMGLNLHLLSGDNTHAVEKTAQLLSVRTFCAEALPEDKLAYVQALQQQGRKVLMVGDGVNDAPVLAQADVSLAMAGGADVARAGSDMVLMNRNLDALPYTLNLAHKTRKIVRQNFAWALFYNAIAVPVAVVGLATPAIAALGMAGSSLLVVTNALRLLRKDAPKL